MAAVRRQNLADQIKRPGDHDARRRCPIPRAPDPARPPQVPWRRCALKPRSRAKRRNVFGRAADLLAGDGQGHDLAGQPFEMAQKSLRILGLQAAIKQNQRARRLFLEIGHGLGEDAAARLVMAAVEPKLGAGRRQRGEPPPAEVLQPSRPGGSGYARLIGAIGQIGEALP